MKNKTLFLTLTLFAGITLGATKTMAAEGEEKNFRKIIQQKVPSPLKQEREKFLQLIQKILVRLLTRERDLLLKDH